MSTRWTRPIKPLAEFAQTWGLVYFVRHLPGRAGLRALALAQATEAIRRGRAHAAAGGLTDGRSNDKEIDRLTGTATTGHEWDGIRELNTPLPRWWLWTVLRHASSGRSATGSLYPAWPLISNSHAGRVRLARRAPRSRPTWRAAGAARPDGRPSSPRLRCRRSSANTQLLDFARAAGPRRLRRQLRALPRRRRRRRQGLSQPQRRRLAVGRQARRRSSRPSSHGVRSGDDKTPTRATCRPSAATASSSATRSRTVADYVRSLVGTAASSQGADLAAGKKVFADNCAVCHGPDGKGKPRARLAPT